MALPGQMDEVTRVYSRSENVPLSNSLSSKHHNESKHNQKEQEQIVSLSQTSRPSPIIIHRSKTNDPAITAESNGSSSAASGTSPAKTPTTTNPSNRSKFWAKIPAQLLPFFFHKYSDQTFQSENHLGVSDISGSSTTSLPVLLSPPLPDTGYRPASPLRHHRRTFSAPRTIKETLDASSSESELGLRMVNEYVLKKEIGRGAFGVVHLAENSVTGEEYAVKEFSKSKLRKKLYYTLLRKEKFESYAKSPDGKLRPAPPMKRRSAPDIHQQGEFMDPLYPLRREIAIMKKIHHENLVNLIEVLSDPNSDSLFMVLEMCKKGVIMDVSLFGIESQHMYTIEEVRNFFRDLILGVEYLHAQGIVHRDIKPDNILLTENNVLKIGDFGVSEMFEKDNDRFGKDLVGSPAFTAPETLIVQNKDVSGRAGDIWACGVTLYALSFEKLPFCSTNILQLYNEIIEGVYTIPEGTDPALIDLLSKMLETDPEKRIKMPEIRVHPWVTANGQDELMSTAENTEDVVVYVSKEDLREAIKGIRGMKTVVKAVNRLKRVVHNRDNSQNIPPSSQQQQQQQQQQQRLKIQLPKVVVYKDDSAPSLENLSIDGKSKKKKNKMFQQRIQQYETF